MPGTFPSDYLDVARRLCQADVCVSDGFVRSSYSRAYYAAFLVARERIRKVLTTEELDAPGAHGVVGRCLRNAKHEKLRSLGSELGNFAFRREDADYWLKAREIGMSPAVAQINATNAHSWIKEFSEIPDADFQAAIT